MRLSGPVCTLQCVFNGGPYIGRSESGQRCSARWCARRRHALAGDVTNEDLTRAERMAGMAAVRRVGDPLAVAGAYQVTYLRHGLRVVPAPTTRKEISGGAKPA